MFYYYSRHGVPVGRFKSRAQWQGDVSRRDGSIRLHDLRLNDSGTYECELRLLEDSSIFRSQTELLVSSEPRGACPAPAASPAAPGVPAVPSPASVLPGRTRSSGCRGCCVPERLRVVAGRGGLWLRGRGGGVPGRAVREEEVPALVLSLRG